MVLGLLEQLAAGISETVEAGGRHMVHFRIPEMTPMGFAAFVTVVLGFILVIVALEVLRRKRELFERIAAQWNVFDALAAQKGLTGEEVELLREIHDAQSGDVSPDALLRLASVYDRSIDEWMEQLEKRGGRPSVAQWEHLARIRSALGFNTLSSETRLSHTRQIPVGQVLRVWSTAHPGRAAHAEIQENHETEFRLRWQDGSSLDVPVGETLNFSSSRQGDGEFRAEIPVTAITGDTITVAHTARLSRQQLRMWVRVPVALEGVAYDLTVMDGQTLPGRMPIRMMDLSGGGAMIAAPREIPLETRGLMDFKLGETLLSGVPFLLLRQGVELRDGWRVGHLCFDGIDTAMQERIMRFVFERQRSGSGKSF